MAARRPSASDHFGVVVEFDLAELSAEVRGTPAPTYARPYVNGAHQAGVV
jgi:hypothetical protein